MRGPNFWREQRAPDDRERRDVQRSLATVVAGGLFLATPLLTLFIIPTFYFVIERVMSRRSERRTAVAESPA
jgi:heavy metal efflux system protein